MGECCLTAGWVAGGAGVKLCPFEVLGGCVGGWVVWPGAAAASKCLFMLTNCMITSAASGNVSLMKPPSCLHCV